MTDALRRQHVQFYTTASYPCSYLPGVSARSQVAAPSELINGPLYSQLVQHGFRRSGQFIYRPHCDTCAACIPVRIPVEAFTPNRSQRRTGKRLNHLKIRLLPLHYEEAHFQLYQRYQQMRHAGGGMDEDDRAQYESFILKSHVDSFLAEFSDAEGVRMVSLIDQLGDGVSAVYTFFDPEPAQAGYGVFNVLWQVEFARSLGLPYVYLGYWVEQCRKMAYKTAYRPIEGLIDGHWRALSTSMQAEKIAMQHKK
jgi:leucyl-tRNA---protein transferase